MSDLEMDKKVEQLKTELRNEQAERDRQNEEALRDTFRKAGLSLRKDLYILQGDTIQAVDVATWAVWVENHSDERMIARTVVRPGVDVSTVFLGTDYNFTPTGPPLLFETLVFGGLLDEQMARYSTLEEARTGHWAMVERVKRAESGESL